MISRLFSLVLCLALCASPLHARLPDLGDVAIGDLSPMAERRIGQSIMQEIRWRDPAYLADAEIEDYLNRLGRRLVAASDQPDGEFEFFAINDPTLNAFAMPGGFIGLHTGLILAAESESELASVMAHEIAHVTQRHIAQLFGRQGQASMVVLASVLVAVLAARSNAHVSEAALAAGQAGAIQQQLGYTRAFEREADRIGLQILERAGFDVRGMPAFFERLQRFTRMYENNAPAYLRTHPLTEERMADLGNRVAQMRYRQVPDSEDFGFVRAKIRAGNGPAQEAVRTFESRFATQPDTFNRYGLARALLRAGRTEEAARLASALHAEAPPSAFIEGLVAEVMFAQRDHAGTVPLLRTAVTHFPDHIALDYLLIEAMLQSGSAEEAARRARQGILRDGRNPQYWALSSRSEAALGRMSAYHRAQAEVHVLRGSLPAAIEQLELARRANDGDFHEMSAIDARLRALQLEEQAERAQRR